MEETQKVHEGRNIKRFREMLGVKQEALAAELGEEWTQKRVSQLEAKETIEKDILEQVAKILHVTPEAIQKFNEDSAVNFISNTFTDFKDNATVSNANAYNNGDITFNPLEKLIEAYEEKEKLHDENKKLYERLLQAEKDKVVYLEKLLEGKKDA